MMIGLVSSAPQFALQAIYGNIFDPLHATPDAVPQVLLVPAELLNIAVQSIVAPLYVAFQVYFYVDMHARREGLDSRAEAAEGGVTALLAAAVLSAACPSTLEPEERADAACKLIEQQGQPPAPDRALLNALLDQPEFSRARNRNGNVAALLLKRFWAWLQGHAGDAGGDGVREVRAVPRAGAGVHGSAGGRAAAAVRRSPKAKSQTAGGPGAAEAGRAARAPVAGAGDVVIISTRGDPGRAAGAAVVAGAAALREAGSRENKPRAVRRAAAAGSTGAAGA